MALPGQHAEFALEHLISALREEGITIRTSWQGYGAPAALEYIDRTGYYVATCNADSGLELCEDNRRVAGLIRSHCALWYTVHPHCAAEPAPEEYDAAAPVAPCMDDTAAAY